MKLNENICIVGKRVTLVPYKKIHVEKYHQWMQSEELLDLTGSEPLSIDEEYVMQKTWHDDECKCTFIVLENTCANELDRMIGDVNMFLEQQDDGVLQGEINIMIAEDRARGKSNATEAMRLIMAYAIRHLHVGRFIAKIQHKNDASHALFKKLGFMLTHSIAAFEEDHYTLNVPTTSHLHDIDLQIQPYH